MRFLITTAFTILALLLAAPTMASDRDKTDRDKADSDKTANDKKADALTFKVIQKQLEILSRAHDPEAAASITKKIAALGTPLVFGNKALFAVNARGASEVRLAGEFNGWGSEPKRLIAAGDSGIFYGVLEFHPAARLEYKVVVDNQWGTDGWNSRVIENGVGGQNSFFTMPGYKPLPRPLAADQSGKGTVVEKKFEEHHVWIYTPAGYDPNRARPYPVQYFQDGEEYLKRTFAAETLDGLISTGKIPAIIAVFVSPRNRMKEYWEDPEYTRFFAERLVPWVDASYHCLQAPTGRGLVGDSLGGLISMHLAYTHPELFSRVASQSGAFFPEGAPQVEQGHATHVLERVRKTRKHPTRIYLCVGTYEQFVENNRSLRTALEKRGQKPSYRELPQGHTWTLWRETLPEALEHLWGDAKR